MSGQKTYPVVERIALGLEAVLKSVTAAGGYQTNVTQVLRPVRLGIPAVPTDPFAVVMTQQDPKIEGHTNPGAIVWRQTFDLGLYIRVSEQDATPFDQLINMFIADAVKAVMAYRRRGGLAINTEVQPPLMATLDKHEGVVMPIDVIYRVSELDPYQQM